MECKFPNINFSLDGALAGKIEGDIVNQYFGGISSVYYGYTASTGIITIFIRFVLMILIK